MEWNYAELSRMAKRGGGPEKFVNTLIKSGERRIIPWLGVAFVGGGITTISIQKVCKYYSNKRSNFITKVESAKEEIIRGIKKYDIQVKYDNTINSAQQHIDLCDHEKCETKE